MTAYREKPLTACARSLARSPIRTEAACALVAIIACLVALATCGVPTGHDRNPPRIELGE